MKKWKWIHRWFSIVLGIILIFWAISGILLNHRDLISNIQISRDYLPASYRIHNWNNATVRSAYRVNDTSVIIYGNIGIWVCDPEFNHFEPFMEGLPKGIDPVRTMKVVGTESGKLFAATQSGLYERNGLTGTWKQIDLQSHDSRVMDLYLKSDSLIALSRSNVYIIKNFDDDKTVKSIQLKSSTTDDGKAGLFRTLWVIHSGELLGMAGKLMVDFLALALVFLIITGYIYFFFPGWIKRRKRKSLMVEKQQIVTKFSIKWHNKAGLWLGGFLIITVFTGMFLRPPMLIMIANARVAKIPFSILDDPNSWHDKLRVIAYDSAQSQWLLGTNEGIYTIDNQFSESPKILENLPPLSVMGINVFEALSDGYFLVGSFNGLFLWHPERGEIIDFISGQTPVKKSHTGSPIGEHLISGLIRMGDKFLIFDYNKGLITNNLPMPDKIRATPMPLWNFALEVHTARIFEPFIGAFYLLIIPLLGLMTLLILVSGFIIYLRKGKKVRKSSTKALPST